MKIVYKYNAKIADQTKLKIKSIDVKKCFVLFSLFSTKAIVNPLECNTNQRLKCNYQNCADSCQNINMHLNIPFPLENGKHFTCIQAV